MKNNNKDVFPYVNNEITLLLFIIIVELNLSYTISVTILTDVSILSYLVDVTKSFVTVLKQINEENTSKPELVSCYILITVFLMPLKVLAFYKWLNSDRDGIYRYLIISPLTKNKPVAGQSFLTDPIRKEKKQAARYEYRSTGSGFFWSILILSFTIITFIITFFYIQPHSASSSSRDAFHKMMLGGVNLWFYWSLLQVLFSSFLLSISFCIIRDYIKFFQYKLKELQGK